MRYAAKRDTSEAPIVARLRSLGAVVTPLDGRDIPDLLVSWRGLWLVAEVKTGKAKVKPGQAAWAASQAARVPVLRTPEDAEAWLMSHVPVVEPTTQFVNAWDHQHETGGVP